MLFSRNELRPLLQRASSNDPTLTSLHLSHKKITNRQLVQISDALRSNATVTEVWLTHNAISDEGNGGAGGSVGYLAGVLENNDAVGEVYLGGNKIGAKGGESDVRRARRTNTAARGRSLSAVARGKATARSSSPRSAASPSRISTRAFRLDPCAASSIAALLQKNDAITDIGLEDNAIDDGGAKMLADALSHNSTLQTLKLQGNDIKDEGTLKTISELLKRNKESAKRRFEEEHPELVTRKIKKPEERKKKKRSSRSKRSDGDGRRSRGSDGKSRSDDGKSRSDGEKRRSDGKSRSDGEKRSGGERRRERGPSSGFADDGRPEIKPVDAADAFIADRKKSLEEEAKSKSKLVDKFKTGLKLGGSGSGGRGMEHSVGTKGAAFV